MGWCVSPRRIVVKFDMLDSDSVAREKQNPPILPLSTHAGRQDVDILLTVCVFFCLFVTDFFAEDEASGIKFCTAVHRHPRQGISYFRELCSHRSPKWVKLASA